jgi:hypothetical protein
MGDSSRDHHSGGVVIGVLGYHERGLPESITIMAALIAWIGWLALFVLVLSSSMSSWAKRMRIQQMQD